MKSNKIIAFVGMPGAGKSICVDYLKTKGWPELYFGGITLDEIKNRGLLVNPENERKIREEIRANEGMDAYAKRMIPKIDELIQNGAQNIIVDGLYSWSEYKILKDKFGDNLVVIAIAAPRNIRHTRLEKRPVRPLTKDEVITREYAEIENIEKGGPIANADFTIVNDKNQTELVNYLENIIGQKP